MHPISMRKIEQYIKVQHSRQQILMIVLGLKKFDVTEQFWINHVTRFVQRAEQNDRKGSGTILLT